MWCHILWCFLEFTMPSILFIYLRGSLGTNHNPSSTAAWSARGVTCHPVDKSLTCTRSKSAQDTSCTIFCHLDSFPNSCHQVMHATFDQQHHHSVVTCCCFLKSITKYGAHSPNKFHGCIIVNKFHILTFWRTNPKCLQVLFPIIQSCKVEVEALFKIR